MARRNGYHIAIETVGPDQAADMLAANQVNRTVRQRRVDQYARDMQRGNWHPVGEPIVISNKEKLVNGQHRLMAVVQAGVSVELPIIRGLPFSVQDVMDTGLKRSFSDVLKLHYEAHSTVNMSAAIRQIHQYRALGTMGQSGGHVAGTSPTTAELIETYERERHLVESLPMMRLVRDKGKVWFAPGLLIATHYIFTETDPEASDTFFERLAFGERLERGNPVLALRQLGQRRPMDMLPKAQAAVLFKGFNFWRAGRHVGLGNLRWRAGGSSPEPFPRLLTPAEIASGASEAVLEEELVAG